MNINSELLILHDFGDFGGGTRWAEAFRSAGWTGPVLAPTMPGHAGKEPAVGGTYELIDPAVQAARELAKEPGDNTRIVVGVGLAGWSAHLVTLAGRAGSLVLVDGLSGPFDDVPSRMARRREAMRAQVEANLAGTDAVKDGLDIRVKSGPLPHSDHALATESADLVSVPTLLLETVNSPVTTAERLELVERYRSGGNDCMVAEIDTPDPATVAAAVVSWLS